MPSYLNSFNQIDGAMVHMVQSIGSQWYGVAWFLSAIVGYSPFLIPAMVLALVLTGKYRVAIEAVGISLLALAAVYLSKALIWAPRPFWVDSSVIRYAFESSSGMPSGHALVSFVILGWVWLRHPKSAILSVGIPVTIFLVGLSRVYLGVHYPSQVIVGWIVGAFMLWAFWRIDRLLFRPRSGYVK
ncbi:MAG: phosphatase PAP2 family protein [Candidatus Paceibacterota bacterium]|jgi:membrane-associated phospholipid phosphatase